jgi:hypothetical protein
MGASTTNSRQNYEASVTRQRESFDRMRAGSAERVHKLYTDAIAELTEKIAREARAGHADSFTAHSARIALTQLQGGIAELTKRMAGELGSATTDAGKSAGRSVWKQIESLEKHYGNSDFVLPIDEALRFIGANDRRAPSLLRVHQSSMDRYGDFLIGAMEGQMGLSMAMGEPLHAMIARIQRTASNEWWRAERIARTECSYAQNAASADAIEDAATRLPGLMLRWNEHVDDATMRPLDNRVAPDSLAMHGIVAIAGGFFEMPISEQVDARRWGMKWNFPPNRPNDRAAASPWHPEWGDVPGFSVVAGHRVPFKAPVVKVKPVEDAELTPEQQDATEPRTPLYAPDAPASPMVGKPIEKQMVTMQNAYKYRVGAIEEREFVGGETDYVAHFHPHWKSDDGKNFAAAADLKALEDRIRKATRIGSPTAVPKPEPAPKPPEPKPIEVVLAPKEKSQPKPVGAKPPRGGAAGAVVDALAQKLLDVSNAARAATGEDARALRMQAAVINKEYFDAARKARDKVYKQHAQEMLKTPQPFKDLLTKPTNPLDAAFERRAKITARSRIGNKSTDMAVELRGADLADQLRPTMDSMVSAMGLTGEGMQSHGFAPIAAGPMRMTQVVTHDRDGAAAAYEYGCITLGATVAMDVNRALDTREVTIHTAHGVSALLHEMLHGAGASSAYVHGWRQAVEEATTEILACRHQHQFATSLGLTPRKVGLEPVVANHDGLPRGGVYLEHRTNFAHTVLAAAGAQRPTTAEGANELVAAAAAHVKATPGEYRALRLAQMALTSRGVPEDSKVWARALPGVQFMLQTSLDKGVKSMHGMQPAAARPGEAPSAVGAMSAHIDRFLEGHGWKGGK